MRRARNARGRSVLGEREGVLIEVATEARIEEVAVVAQREPDRIVEGGRGDRRPSYAQCERPRLGRTLV